MRGNGGYAAVLKLATPHVHLVFPYARKETVGPPSLLSNYSTDEGSSGGAFSLG